MSKGSTPVHHFDGFYDPDYTAEISTKMQVPDRIMVVQQDGQPARPAFPSQPEKLVMNVPDRIMLSGGEFAESRVESRTSLPAHHDSQQSAMNGDYYPVAEAIRKDSGGGKLAQLQQNGYVMDYMDYNRSHPLTPPTPPGMTSFSNGGDDELSFMRRQVKMLSRRIVLIEQDNQQRQQREIVVYSIGVVYFLLKGLLWLHRHW